MLVTGIESGKFTLLSTTNVSSLLHLLPFLYFFPTRQPSILCLASLSRIHHL